VEPQGGINITLYIGGPNGDTLVEIIKPLYLFIVCETVTVSATTVTESLVERYYNHQHTNMLKYQFKLQLTDCARVQLAVFLRTESFFDGYDVPNMNSSALQVMQ
jgi:hypothetical protein